MPARSINYKYLSYALFAALLLLVLLTFRRYGISWDEGVHDKLGSDLLSYYLGLLRGRADIHTLEAGNPVAYGAVFNLLVAMVQKFSPLERFDTRHLVNALVGLLGILGCWRTARLLSGERAAFWAALLLAIIPGYYGHMYFNPKDIPFAAGYIWSLYFILRATREFPRISWLTLLKLSLAVGLTMGMRVGGVMLVGYFGLAVFAETALAWSKKSLCTWKAVLHSAVLPILATGTAAYLVMLAFWPWAQQNLLSNPLLALGAQEQFDYKSTVLYRGIDFSGQSLPVDYIPGTFLVTTPEVILVLLAVGLVIAGTRLFREREWYKSPSPLFKGSVLLVFSVLFPVIIIIVRRSVIYDGMRHFIFILPPIACLAGISCAALIDKLERQRSKAWTASPAFLNLALIALVSWQVFSMAQLFPYEYIYYNSLVGGLQGAYRRYETDYWGLATSEAARWLENYAEDTADPKKNAYPVYTCAGRASVAHYFASALSLVQSPDRAHFGIVTTRWGCDQQVQGTVLFTVERLGVPLAAVKELK